MGKILFICNYNLVRSQIAEVLSKKTFPDFEVSSSGLKSLDSAYAELTLKLVTDCLEKSGHSFPMIRSKMVCDTDIDSADYIISFTQEFVCQNKKIIYLDVPDVMKTNPKRLPETVMMIEQKLIEIKKSTEFDL